VNENERDPLGSDPADEQVGKAPGADEQVGTAPPAGGNKNVALLAGAAVVVLAIIALIFGIFVK
jgi:hypothetical protein